jgi:hypothetical protein
MEGTGMENDLDVILTEIGEEFKEQISGNSRHYLEVSISKKSEKLGYYDLQQKFENVYAIVPLKHPVKGMKVRVDGRTFKNYSQFASGIAVPGYVAQQSKLPLKTFTPRDSMILNF